MRGTMDIIFSLFSETYVRLLTSVTSQSFSKYSKSYKNLNVTVFPRRKGLWKFNKPLIKNENYREQMKTLIKHVIDNLDQDNIVDPQFRWEYLKYELRKFSIHCSKGIARNKKTERTYLENKLKTLENSPSFVNNSEYIETNEKLDKIYLGKANSIRIRSKCNCYEHKEKSSKFFLNLEKSRALQNQIRKSR